MDGVTIFQRVLGDDFFDLDDEIQSTHVSRGPSLWSGQASVERGNGILARLVGLVFGFPNASDAVEVTVRMVPANDCEHWERRFDKSVFRSVLRCTSNGMTERFWPFTFLLDLQVEDGELHYPVKSGRIGFIPLPRWALPVSRAKEFGHEGRFNFDVALFAPLTWRLLMRYRGWLQKVLE